MVYIPPSRVSERRYTHIFTCLIVGVFLEQTPTYISDLHLWRNSIVLLKGTVTSRMTEHARQRK